MRDGVESPVCKFGSVLFGLLFGTPAWAIHVPRQAFVQVLDFRVGHGAPVLRRQTLFFVSLELSLKRVRGIEAKALGEDRVLLFLIHSCPANELNPVN